MESILSHCAALFSTHGSLLWVLFVGGLTGGFTHCLTMCGGLSACRAACSGKCAPTRKAKLEMQLNLAHHAGRMVSYAALGFATALFSRQLVAYGFWPKLEALMLVLAGLMFLASSVAGAGSGLHRFFMPLHAASTRHTFLRGALLGFMPCGLIYAALMLVAASASPVLGAAGMALFVLGTLPAQWLANMGVSLLAMRWQAGMQQFGRVAMALNGVLLLLVAGRLVA